MEEYGLTIDNRKIEEALREERDRRATACEDLRIAQASDNNCCARAISVMRLALGYEEGLPLGWDTLIKDKYVHELISALGDCFPDRNIIVACSRETAHKASFSDRVQRIGDGDLSGGRVELDRHLFAFVYGITDDDSHIVIGTPGFLELPDGFEIALVFAVSLDRCAIHSSAGQK